MNDKEFFLMAHIQPCEIPEPAKRDVAETTITGVPDDSKPKHEIAAHQDQHGNWWVSLADVETLLRANDGLARGVEEWRNCAEHWNREARRNRRMAWATVWMAAGLMAVTGGVVWHAAR